jgi:Sec7-like guanine-nucleotide exchange factor
MLNTDRHNPNVRADRKMTLEQFIKYNTNYGSDVNQTRDLPRSVFPLAAPDER